jgi:copper(I)-binding protein
MFLGASALVLAGTPALADGIEVSNAWTRATVRGASVAAGYMTLDNQGAGADTLKGASCDRAGRVEVHQSREEGGIMTMRALPDGVEIKAGKRLELKPGGYHLMIIGLKSPFALGELVHVTLHFAKAGDVGADLKVMGFGATGADALSGKAKAKN